MRRLRSILLFIVGAFSIAAHGESPGLWPGLVTGPHVVGYRVAHLHDGDRPVQVSLWYPASGDDGSAPVVWRDYFLSAATERNFSMPDKARSVRHLEEMRDAAISAGAGPEQVEQLLDAATSARRDATRADGPFPLVVFVPGMGAPAFQNTVACEYLASHGFIVASFPSAGRDSREMTEDEAGVTAQVGDIAFVIRAVRELAPVDPKHIGLAGYSWGGLTAMFAAMRGIDVDALVALDPTFMVQRGHVLARALDGYDPETMNVPVMLMIAAAREWKERDVSFFEELSGSHASMLRFHDFKHGDFASVIIRFFVHALPDGGGRDVERIDAGYAAECRYLLAFFDAHLRQGEEGRAFLSGEPEKNGIGKGLVSIERK